jgi:SPP1 family predicted phage head-tail adaptor
MDDLREKIEFVTTENEYEGSILIGQKEVIFYTCRCNYLDVSGREFNAADTNFSELKSSFRVRYCKFTKDLNVNTEKYKIRYSGNLYDIKFALDYKNLHKYIDIKATLIK